MEIAALVLGIVGLVWSTFGSFFACGWIGSICGVVAIILGAISMKRESKHASKAKAGFIMGIIAVCLGIVLTVVCVSCIACVGSSFDDLLYELEYL